MASQHNEHQQYRTDVTNFIVGAGTTTQLTVRDQDSVIDLSAADETINLPPVSQAKGMIFTLVADGTVSYTATIAATDGPRNWSNITLNSTGEYVALYSTGDMWIELKVGYS